MELSELLQVTGKVGPIVLGIATIATAVLYVMNLVRKSYRATARARRAEKDRDESRKQNEEVERDLAVIAAERDKLREAFEDARRAEAHSRQDAAQHQRNAAKFFDAGRKEYLRRRELEASAAAAADNTAKLQLEVENKSAALNRVSRTEDKKSNEMKLLDQTAAVAAEYWKPLPVRFVKSAIHDSGHYAKYQRDFASKRQAQLPAIAVKDIQDEYACLVKELDRIEAELIAETEQSTDESLSPSRVSP
jgi:hypothetical protein